jgi:hypothetical protein
MNMDEILRKLVVEHGFEIIDIEVVPSPVSDRLGFPTAIKGLRSHDYASVPQSKE